ncbi:hypothetical protein IAU60_004313 [Kwoniella sp. DSM 27419]
MPPRTYDPLYDNPLGPMTERVHDPEDPGFLGPFPPGSSRSGGVGDNVGVDGDVGDAETVSALKTLFGESAGPPDHGDHDHDHHLRDQHVDIGAAPTLASHHESAPAPAAPSGSPATDLHGDGRSELDIMIDPALAQAQDETHGAGGSTSPGTGPGLNAPAKRKATSRANMLARGAACEFCKRRKLKCSAEVPTCANCAKIGRECVYSQKKQRSRVKVLEDRLQELEKRLDGGRDSPSSSATPMMTLTDPGPGTTSTIASLATPAAAIPAGNSEPFYDGFTLSSFNLGLETEHAKEIELETIPEPDLMTLADAAAGDATAAIQNGLASWEGLTPDQVVAEILKAVGGAKGVGEKIIAHLIQLYVTPPSCPSIHLAVPPNTLLSRLAGKAGQPLHPSLILSILPYLTPLSPSATLAHPSIPSLLIPHARTFFLHGLTAADPRFLDMLTGAIIRSFWLYTQARYLEGLHDTSTAIGLTYATGLSKLGYVGERFVGSMDIPGRAERIDRELKSRQILKKGVVASPPETPVQLGERINLFWFAYINDRAASIGWGLPSSFSDEEITTPWPRDEYESTEALLDNRTVYSFMTASKVDDASHDSAWCGQLKSITLLYHAKRLFDTPPTVATPERTAKLMRIARGYMATFPALTYEQYQGNVTTFGMRAQAWSALHTTMSVLHAKEEIDAPRGSEKEHLDRSIDSAGKVLEVYETVQRIGDEELTSVDPLASVIAQLLGTHMWKYASRLTSAVDRDPGDEARLVRLEGMKEGFQNALNVMGKKTRFASVAVQLLANVGLGSDFKLGEYERCDNME